MVIGYIIGAVILVVGFLLLASVLWRRSEPRYAGQNRSRLAKGVGCAALGAIVITYLYEHTRRAGEYREWDQFRSGDILAYGVGGLVVAIGVYFILTAIADRPGPRGEAAIPPAQVSVDGKSPLRTKNPDARPRRGMVSRVVGGLFVGGLGAAIIVVAKAILHQEPSDWGKKGRVLRLRGRAALPVRTTGSGWTDTTGLPAVNHLSREQRASLSELWLISAQMEHASVAAFSQLSLHLSALGAPSELVERTHLAALDEIRHARRCYAIAGTYAGKLLTAGPIAELVAPDTTPIDAIRLAVGTLVDGCLAEGLAADVARTASTRATDPVVRDSLAMIARDEETHAELGWAILTWCLEMHGVRGAVAARVAKLDDELAPKLPDLTGFSDACLAEHGVLDQGRIGELATARIAAVRDRALEVLQPVGLAA